MKKLLLFALLLPLFCKAQDTLHEGTLVNAKLMQDLNSKKLTAGEIIELQLADNIINGNKIIVPAGAKVTATITSAERSKDFGKTAKLSFTIDYLYAPGNKVVKLKGTIENNGKHSIDFVDAGPQVKYKKGTIFKAYIDHETIL